MVIIFLFLVLKGRDKILNIGKKDIILVCSDKLMVYTYFIILIQSAKLSGSPKPVACKIVHGRIK